MERCSACRARLDTSPICPRCGADFTLAMRAGRQAAQLLGRSIHAWAKGEHGLAEQQAMASIASERAPLALALAAMLRAAAQVQAQQPFLA